MQTAITATTDSITAVSSEAALKTTTAYLSTQISNLVGGAPPETLDTLAEIAAALNNQNNFAGSVTTALATKAAVADVSALTDTLALKANQTDYTSLATVVSTKAAVTAASDASTSIAMINNNIVALVTELSALQANGSNVSPDTVAVNSISLTDLQNWTKEIYIKMGLTNANGTINERINRLKNPTLVSGTLAVAATTVTQLITVKFDKDQTSATVTGGVDNLTTTVNNMVLDASNNYTFSVVYTGSIAYYNTNKRDVSITALESQYSLAPLVPTVTVISPTPTVASTTNMNSITATMFANQYQTNFFLGYGGNLAGWTKAGSNAIHIVDIANKTGASGNTSNYAAMFIADNVITQTTGVSNSNVLNGQYTVSFKAGPAVYDNGVQATTASELDGIVFEVLRGNNTVLATHTYRPGAWAPILTLTSRSFTYTGDGTGNIRIQIKSLSPSVMRFGGCVDDVVIYYI
jgi:hypothetical protein